MLLLFYQLFQKRNSGITLEIMDNIMISIFFSGEYKIFYFIRKNFCYNKIVETDFSDSFPIF